MLLASEELAHSRHWQRRHGRDHFFVTTTWSTARQSFYNKMMQLGRQLGCGAAVGLPARVEELGLASDVCLHLQINLGKNQLGPEGAKALGPAIAVSASLTQVLALLVGCT